jgi:Raf kinase inhibitor-like YbhB/YbcL family protein
MKIESQAFRHLGAIPAPFTCEGQDVSPPLAWLETPPGVATFALIVDDPDAPDPEAPRTTWVHWVVYDLPGSVRGLDQDASRTSWPAGAREGLNDWRRQGYGGPCPPVGRHRYFFKLYALDAALGDLGRPTKARLEQALEGHILARAELIGTYQKTR